MRLFINNNIFLMATAFITFAWRYYNDRLFVQKLSLEYDLSQDKKQLEVYSLQLKAMVEERTKELRESEQWHRSLFENATDGIIVLDDKGIIVNVNDKTCEMHGFSRDALVGAHIKLLEIREDREKMAERMRRILDGESIVYEAKHHKKDGTLLYLEVSSKAITIGNTMFIQSFYRDITEKKKFQEHLLQTQKMESIGVLAGGIAHDFNNILTAILGHTEIVRRYTAMEERALRSLNVIEDASRRAGRMISKLLGFARKTDYELVSLNLNDVVYDTVKLLERVIDSKISLNLELANQIPLIQGDINQIEQIVMNLIVNARDAMPKGGKIAIRTESIAVAKGMPGIPPYIHPGDYNMLTITDTGSGIPDDIVNKIFEPFFTTKEQGKGTGLGLSMVYGAVKEHQGYITVQSKLGVGTTFTVYLPVARTVPSEGGKGVSTPSVNGNETLLVVDDEEEILSSMQEALTRHGYRVVPVSDPSSAMDTFKKISGEIALVITDIVMPQVDGKELIQQIKLIKPEVKILAISGYTKYVANKEEIKDISGFLQKPFETPHLLSVVRRILDTKPRSTVRN
jgi:two-component system cell cycle sensor histidine kinase/response regulator CckA